MLVRVLGPVRVGDHIDQAVAPRGDRPRDVLAVLVARRGRPVRADVVLDLVWGSAALSLTPATVHTVVSRLRRQLGDELVVTTDAGYLVPATVGVDADLFAALVAAGRDAGEDQPARVARWREALALWTGSAAYAGVRDDLVLAERVRLEELRRRVRAELGDALLDPAAPEPAAAEALTIGLELVAEHPLDEAGAVLAMRAADRLQRQGEALEIFAGLRRRLREDLGVDPGPVATAAQARILARDAAPVPTAAPARRVHTSRRLPVPASRTVGREAELAAVLETLRAGRRLVTITGAGGVGKSRLLSDVGAAVASDRDLVHLALSGHQAGDVRALAAGLAVTAGVPLAGDDPVDGLVRALRTSEISVLVDEAEWVLEPAAELAAAVLAGCPGVQLVVTSRVPLRVVGERVVPLHPLAVPAAGATVDEVRTSPAVCLLVERLADRGAVPGDDSALSDDELGVLAEVVRRVDGLPLAIELVAGQAVTVPLRQLLDLVEQPLDIESRETGRHRRQHSLRRTISWSASRLRPGTRDALTRLAVFADPFTPVAARAIAGLGAAANASVLAELAAHHLVALDRTDGGLTFRLLRTVRDLALEELAASGHLEETTRRHARWFAEVWRDSPLTDELVEHVGRTYDDHLEALAHLLARGEADAAADVCLALSRRWLFVEAPGPGLRWTAQVLASQGLCAQQWARLRVVRAAFLQHADWTAEEHTLISAMLHDDADWSCQLGLMSAISAYVRGDAAAARGHLDRSLEVATVRAPHHLPELIATRAAIDAADGRHDDALAAAREAQARTDTTTASAVQLVTVLPKVALALLDAGRAQEAYDVLASAADEADERFGIQPTATIAVNAGWAALATERPDLALRWFARSLLGPQAFVSPAAVGEAAAGAGAAVAGLGRPGAAELLGEGRWLLVATGNVLPPSLAAHVEVAEARVGSASPPDPWTVDLAAAHVSQLVRNAGSER